MVNVEVPDVSLQWTVSAAVTERAYRGKAVALSAARGGAVDGM